MKHITSRLLALLLTVAMIVSIMPAVYAADEDVTIVENEQPTVEKPIVENSMEDTTEDTTVEPAKAVEANFSEGTTTDVAKTADGVTYATLADAIAAAKDGETVTLLADRTEDVTITTDITLDLGGKTLTNADAGKATISVTGGTVTVKNGSVKGGKSYYNIEVTKGSNANLTLENVTATAGNTGSSMIDNYGDLTITSGTYTGGLNVVKSEEDSKLTINGGTFTLNYATNGYTAVILVYGDTTITGGEFIQNVATTGRWDHPMTIMTGLEAGHTAPTTKVTGGTFTNKLSGGNIFWGVGKATSDNFEVSGGTYNKTVSDGFFKDGYFAKKNADGTYGADGPYAAKIGSTGYDTLAAAVEAVANNGTITLLQDISSDRINLETKSFTVELNGHTLTSTAAYGVMFCAKNGKKITVKGDKYSKLVGTLMVTSGTDGHIVIKDGTYENPKYCPIYINGSVSSENSTLTVKSATIIANGTDSDQDTGCAVYLAGYCKSTFTDTKITAPVTGIEIRAGKLTLKNCTVTGGNGTVTTDANGNGTTVTNAALAISQHTTKKPIDVTITGGKYTATAALLQTDVQSTGSADVNATVNSGTFNGTVSAATDKTIAVKGGKFTSAVPENCCAEGFVPTQNTDGTYGVKVDTSVAEVNGTKYESLADAFAAAENGQTVKLLADVTLDAAVNVPAGKTVALDLNGKKLSTDFQPGGTKHYYAIDNYGTFTLQDSSTAQTGEIRARGIENFGGGKMVIESGKIVAVDNNGGAAIWNLADLTIQGGTFVAEYEGTSKDQYGPGCVYNEGSLTINGGIFTSANKRTYAVVSKSGAVTIDPADGKTVEISGAHGGVGIDGGTATIKGGSYASSEYYGLYVSNDATKAEVTVTGGTFTGKEYSALIGSDGSSSVNSTLKIEGGTFNMPIHAQGNTVTGAIQVSGGTFSSAVPEEYCATGYIPQDNGNGTYGVQEYKPIEVWTGYTGTKVASYKTIAEAATNLGENKWIVVAKDYTLTENFSFADGIYLDVATGATLTVAEGVTITVEANAKRLGVREGAALVNNGTIVVCGSSTKNGFAMLYGTFSGNELTVPEGYFLDNNGSNYFATANENALYEITFGDGTVKKTADSTNIKGGNVTQIKLLGNVTKGGWTIDNASVGPETVLDLNGHTLSYDGANPGYATLNVYTKVTIKNGTIKYEGTKRGAIDLVGSGDLTIASDVIIDGGDSYGIFTSGTSKLTVNGTVKANGFYAIAGNGSKDNGGYVDNCDITVNDGAVISAPNGIAIYHPELGTVAVNGGTISGHTGIELCAGKLVVSGGSITSTGNNVDATGSQNAILDGAAISIINRNYPGGTPTAEITDGTIKATGTGMTVKAYDYTNNAVTDWTDAGVNVNISGGTFSSAVLPEYCAEGYIPQDNGNGTYGVTLAPPAPSGGGSSASVGRPSVREDAGQSQAAAEQTHFIDVPRDSWYYSSVYRAHENGLIDGVGGERFDPDSTLTVAQAIKLSAALHQLDRTGEVSLKNGAENWYDAYVSYAVANGILEERYAGYSREQMNAPVTRSEFVRILHGALEHYEQINTVADNAIPDVKLGDAFAAAIYELYRAGILQGNDTAGTFRPESTIKRSEAAAILLRMFEPSARKSFTLGA